ncbi:hypothetical protein JCM11641_000083 [Rhodosporidiobolus odoratus]
MLVKPLRGLQSTGSRAATSVCHSTRSRAKPPTSPPAPLPTIPSIVHEDARFLVIDKPAGVALQGQYGSPPRKQWDDLLAAVRARDGCEKAAPAHRLDKATSGCLLMPKTALHASRIATQLQRHEVQREYLAVVHGRMKTGYQGDIDVRLTMDDDRVRVCQDGTGVEARTLWECLASSTSGFSLLSLKPQTGRKHQLRVHCADVLRAPIVGDFKLAPTAPHVAALSELGLPLDTVLLHARRLSFYAWEKSGKRTTITTEAPLPHTFQRFCKAYKLRLPPS